MNFADKPQTKKGAVGEKILDRFLVAKNVVPYKPLEEIQATHPFDRLCASIPKKRIFIADAKTKEARLHYPDTGIDIRHYEQYVMISKRHNVQIFLAFIDADARKVYGNFLSHLEQPRTVTHKNKELKYPIRHNGIIYFPLVAMRDVGPLSDEDIRSIREFSTRDASYEALSRDTGVVVVGRNGSAAANRPTVGPAHRPHPVRKSEG